MSIYRENIGNECLHQVNAGETCNLCHSGNEGTQQIAVDFMQLRNNSADEPASMTEAAINKLFDDYTDYLNELLRSPKLELEEVLDKLTEFAQTYKPVIIASLDFDSNPDLHKVN